jgi:ribosomal protein L37AE/L43A
MNMDKDTKGTKLEPSIGTAVTDMRRELPSIEADDTTCPRCNESQQLAKVKGCIKCLHCGFKFDCNGW